jgi:hypothetical protein
MSSKESLSKEDLSKRSGDGADKSSLSANILSLDTNILRRHQDFVVTNQSEERHPQRGEQNIRLQSLSGGRDIKAFISEASTVHRGLEDENPWKSDKTATKEIEEKMQSVDYTRITQNSQVIFIGDTHGMIGIRRHLFNNAEKLKKAGITHFAIEAFSGNKDVFERLNDTTDLSHIDVGPESQFPNTSDPFAGRAGAERVIRAMVAHKIKVVPIDLLDSTNLQKHLLPKEREAHLAHNLGKLLESNPRSKVAVLIGSYHTSKGMYPAPFMRQPGIEYDYPSLAQNIIDAHYSTATIKFFGRENAFDAHKILRATHNAKLNDKEFMINMRSYANIEHIPFNNIQPDFIIHLPSSTREGM